MNRSILIVLCDFLLLSLLAFSTVDLNQTSPKGALQMGQPAASAKQITGRQDLGEVMKLALDEERKNRDQLQGELAREQASAREKNQQIEDARNQLQAKEQQAAVLVQERAALAEQQAHWRNQFDAAQTNIAALNEQLHASTVESVITKEQRAAMEAEARKDSEKADELARALAQLRQTNQDMLSDRSALQNQLQMSEAANRSALAQMSQLQEEVDAQRRENTRLADGVKALAVKSSDLAREIHDTRPMTPNMIFDEMISNRVTANFIGFKPGMFGGQASKDKQAETILVTDQTNIFALCHVQDTPLTLWNPGTQWEQLDGTLTRGSAVVPIESLSFYLLDPRVVLLPVPARQARSLGCKIYHLSNDPYVFQDAVVVGTRGNYYGECKFQIDVSTPQYLKMDHSSIRGLFGKFNPSSGDLVLSKSGELLGVMANNNYCAVIRHFDALATFRFGAESRHQQTAQTLASLYAVVAEKPFRLQ